jgi:hypothetical protein
MIETISKVIDSSILFTKRHTNTKIPLDILV